MSDTNPKSLESIHMHKRQVRRWIMLPILLPALLMVALLIGLFVLVMVQGTLDTQQLGVITSIMVILFVLIPLVVIFFALDALLLILMFGSGNIYQYIQKPSRLAHEYSDKLLALTDDYTQRIAKPVIEMRVRVARWRMMVVGTPETELEAQKKQGE